MSLHTICGEYADAVQMNRDLDEMDRFYLAIPCWDDTRRVTWAHWDEVLGIRAQEQPE